MRCKSGGLVGQFWMQITQAYREASTITHVDKNDPPVLLIHGTLDTSVPVWHSDKLSEKLGDAQVPFIYDRIEGWPHDMDLFSPLGERTLLQCYGFLKTLAASGAMTME
ncbi:MAG: prolyl oligopeptidase family serine peptidase [Parahaliea sp.]